MKNIVLAACMSIAGICTGQDTIGAYNFIEVPDRFEFVSGDNPYQMSEMMVYYLEKKGLKAYRQIDSPNAPKCDALYADMLRSPSVLNSRLTFVLKDCNDRIVFQSKEGKSKVKSYAKAYPDALRMAFKTFVKSDIKISEVSKTPAQTPIAEKVAISEPKVVKKVEEIKETPQPKVIEKGTSPVINKIPESSFSNYKLKENTYLLKKVTSGFTLFLVQEGSENFIKVGELKVAEDASFVMVDIYGENKPGYFNEKQNLVIQLASGSELVYTKEP